MKTQNLACNRRIIVVCVAILAALMFGINLLPFTPFAAFTAFARSKQEPAAPADIGRAYVSLPNYGRVAYLDTAAHTYLGSVDVTSGGCYSPYQLVMSPDEAHVFVACSSSVAVIATATNTVIQNISLPSTAYDITFVQGGDYALVSVRDYYTVAVIDTATFAVVDSMATSNPPERLATHPYLDYAYVTTGYGGLEVIDTNTFAVVQTIGLTGYSYDVVASPDGQLAFVSDNYYPGGLHVINANTNSLITTITAPGSMYNLSISPDGETVFGGSGYNGIFVFDVPTLTYETTINGAGDAYNPVLNCTGTEMYIGGGYNNNVPVVDIATYTVSNYVSLGGYYGPRGIAICPDYSLDGVVLAPPEQSNDGALGEMVVHEMILVNGSDTADSYDVSLGAFNWDSALSTAQVGPLQPGESATFTVSVTVPVSADWYDEDSVTIYATSVTSPSVYSDTAVATTRAYASPLISTNPDEFASTQFVNEVVTQPLTISNGNGITLTYDIAAQSGTLSVEAQLGHGRSQDEIRSLLAQSLQTEDEHNTGLPTISRYTLDELRGLQGSLNILAWTTYVDYYGEFLNSLNAIAQYTTYSLTETTTTDPVQLALLLQGADVFLVPEQEFANYSTMYNLGQAWQNTLNDFLAGGGTIVVMEHCQVGSGLYVGSGLMDVNFFDCAFDGVVDVVSPNHPLALNLPASFTGMNGRAEYYTTSAETIITSQSGNFVTVAADEVNEGRIVMMGFDFYSYNDEMSRLLANAVLWQDRTVPWLYTVPVSGSVATNDTAVVNVTLDATNLQPGVYTADLRISHNGEPQNPLLLPVTMTVQPTANMGWVEGIITDAGTGSPLEATIIAQGQPYTITSDADTGHYQLWLDAGNYTLQVSADGYVAETQTVNIVAQQGTTQDFDLVLNVPVLNITHEDMSVAQDVGQTTTRALTITNDGPASLSFEIGEQDTSPVSLMLSAQHNGENVRLTETLLDLTGVHILYDRSHGQPDLSYYSTFVADLESAGATIDENLSSPIDAALLAGYDVLWVNCCGYAWSTDELTAVANWLDQGGGVLVHGDASDTTNNLASLYDISYQATDHFEGPSNNITEHPISEGVTTVYVGHNGHYSLLPTNVDSVVVVRDAQLNEPHIVAHQDGQGKMVVVASSDFDNGYITYNDNQLLANNTMAWLAINTQVPWLNTVPVSGTVAGYSSQSVNVNFDATYVQPGTYTADLIVKSNDLEHSRVTVPVTMTVSPAPGMGQVMGTVTDLWTAVPLAATVQLVGVYTDTAAPDYSIWANAGSHTLIASAEGYMTTTYTITIPANGVVVQDIALEPAQPRLEDMPEELVVTAVPNAIIPHHFTIANTGPLPLEFAWHEITPTLMVARTPSDLNGKVIMYDRAHGQGDLANYSTLAAAINNAGGLLTVNFAFPITADILNNVDVLWIDCCGYTNWTFAELQAVNDWMETGGAVLVHSENYPAAADVAGIYNITYQCCQYSYGTTTDILPHPTTVGVSSIYLDYSYDALNYTAAADVTVRDTNGYAQAVAQEQNGGKMVVIDSWLFNDGRINQADNMLFAMNVMNWLADPAYGDVPWLSVLPLSGDIAGHSIEEFTVIVDTTGLPLGTHEAVLALEHNDPAQESPLLLPVTVQVVAQTAAVTLTPMTTSGSGLPGTPVTYTLTVQNSGNGPDTFAISVSSDWVATPSMVTTSELMPGQSQQFTVVVQIPQSAAVGSADDTTVTATSQFNNTITQTATLTTTAVSSMVHIYLPVILKP
jgi:DNA-binding beta-propeller fold protein YncE